MAKAITKKSYTLEDTERRYFLYRHLRNDTGQPFYIGIGSKPLGIVYPSTEYERAYSFSDRTSYWLNIVNKHGYTVEILFEDLTFEEVEAKEIEFIALYGREDTGKGILVNLTDGGGGRKNYVTQESTKELLRQHNIITLEEHLKVNVFPEPNTGCWLWAGMVHKGKDDIALINYKGKTRPAHRVLYEYLNNVIISRRKALKRVCGNPCCVNPDHCYVIHNQPDPANIPKALPDDLMHQVAELQFKHKLNPREISNRLSIPYKKLRNVCYSKTLKALAPYYV